MQKLLTPAVIRPTLALLTVGAPASLLAPTSTDVAGSSRDASGYGGLAVVAQVAVEMTHRRFIPGGTLAGYSNQVPG